MRFVGFFALIIALVFGAAIITEMEALQTALVGSVAAEMVSFVTSTASILVMLLVIMSLGGLVAMWTAWRAR